MTQPTSAAPCACGTSRRRLLQGAGAVSVAGASAALLSACGGRSSPSAASTAADGALVVPAADTGVGSSTYYRDAKIIVSQPQEGDFVAFGSTCPHAGCAVSEREGAVLVCPCHGSRFDPATGDVVQGPATTGLTVLDVTVDGGDLLVRG
ncbi:Rieske (2Fe-2S) protein [Ornithinimicrobium avium]|uniref:Cytochrome bc1 complex Rieske iron-sulfur subunit n=1 Tax=Ornithinimicrobium avium TaxID=2283195 RepID=A0A345NJC6_9MICO|nr:Rieske (2Fe-2S) protein [Ornithinimicrobium avium]AXH95134.1 Rieske (2Fe-2S) protein [Ornithinimicrobium avium]